MYKLHHRLYEQNKTYINTNIKRKGDDWMCVRKTKQIREFEPILFKNGFRFARSKGSHFIYINRHTHKHITINKDLNRMVRERLIKEYNLEV